MFPEVFVINLDKRKDRWIEIQRVCSAANILPVRIPAIDVSPGWLGCGLSHLTCIQKAKDKQLPWILILEDDATFTIESIQRFITLLPYLWNNRDKWERFNGGPTFANRQPIISILNSDLRLLYVEGLMTHFNLINSLAYDQILQWNHTIEYDRFLMRFKNIATFPHISVQVVGISDISRRPYADYEAQFRVSEKLIKEKFYI